MAAALFQKKIFLVLAFFSFLSSSFLPIPTLASEGNFSVSPLFTDIRLDSEEEHTFTLDVGNTTNEPMVFRLSFLDFGSLDESGGVAFLGQGSELQKRYGLASWMSAEKDVITVLPKSTETLRFTVMNRDSLSPGGHYGAVLFRAEKEGGDEQEAASSVSITPDFTALVFVRKSGGEIRQLEYRDSIVRTDFFGVPDKVSERFRNSGNIHLTLRGITEVHDMFGRLVRKGILNEESGIILPESYRVYPIALKPLEKAFLPGFYTIEASYRFDGEESFRVIQSERIFSWKLLLLWLVGIIGGGFVARRMIRRKKQNVYEK